MTDGVVLVSAANLSAATSQDRDHVNDTAIIKPLRPQVLASRKLFTATYHTT